MSHSYTFNRSTNRNYIVYEQRKKRTLEQASTSTGFLTRAHVRTRAWFVFGSIQTAQYINTLKQMVMFKGSVYIYKELRKSSPNKQCI